MIMVCLVSLIPSLSNPQIFITCSMKNRGRKPGRVSHVMRATDVTRLFGGVYTDILLLVWSQKFAIKIAHSWDWYVNSGFRECAAQPRDCTSSKIARNIYVSFYGKRNNSPQIMKIELLTSAEVYINCDCLLYVFRIQVLMSNMSVL